ncbi:NHS-like protein 3 [Trachinotus anak]|uniref:NHS-like protein 3 n=1 Tax=Trachinotus anak TaxID=443729 RepID=UPI0039F23EA8
MSNRDSLGFGDLLPQDVVQVFAQDKHSKRGRKKRRHSLGRALGWLKGRKRKNLGANGQNLSLGPAFDLALDVHPAGHQGSNKGGQKSGRQTHPHGNSHGLPKRDDDDKTPAPPLLQENVFIEASRPKYLEDLHSEALEALKMVQQEDTNNGVEYQDNESTISSMTIQTDGEGGGFMTDSTIPDTSSVVSVQSSVSTRSTRSGLTRQGSTFRPLNSGKRSEKAKRRRHRKTVAGIPQHVQRELGLDRVGWTVTQKLDEEEFYNGETDDSPTTDGPQQAAESQKGANANLQDKKVIQPLNKDQVEQLNATHAGHRDDLALLNRLGSDLSGGQRPRSLAVPWMTTANSLQQEPPSPVMSMSPQAAYMSKIIPNAVLPPSIEVVEISRGRSRSSLRTVSKSSLLLSSPAPSRASSRASSTRTISSRASTITSAYHRNPPNLSDSSCWSNSESSETLVSDSSTISSSSTPRQNRSENGDISAKEDKVSIHSSISKASKCTSNGKLIGKVDAVKKEGQFVRSLSVMKPKRAPPPPSRSYSLHNRMKRRSRDLAEVKVISGESSLHSISASGEENEKNKLRSSPVTSRIIDSPGYNADTSSLDDSTGSVLFSPTKSQAHKAKEAAKVQQKGSRDTSQEKQELLQENKLSKVISPSSGYSSQDATSPQFSKQHHGSSPSHKRGILAKLQRLFPGSSSAGSAPSSLTQPETPENTKSTADSKPDSVDATSVSPTVRTLRDLFNIPPPPKVHAPPPPPPEVWAHSKRTFELLLGPPAPDNVYAIIKKNPKDRRQQRQPPSASPEGSVKSLVVERKHKNPAVTVESINGSLHVLERKEVQDGLNAEMYKEKNERLAQNVDLKENSTVTEKDEKVRVSDILNGMLVKAVEKREERLAAMRGEEVKKTFTQVTEVETHTDTLPAISSVRIPPSPSPPVLNQPLAKQTTEAASVTSVRAVVSPESSWPPPPPPMAQAGASGPDEIDFPLPPPPLFGEVPPERSIPGGNSSCATTSVVSVVTTVTKEAELQKSSSSQGIAPPPLNIPPPPSYTAPPPPLEAVSPPTVKKVFPPPKEVFLPPPTEFSPPPPPKEVSPPPVEVSLVRLEQSPPPPVQEVPSTLVKDVSPPLVIKVSPLPPEEIAAPSAEEVALSSSQEDTSQSSVGAALVSKLDPPQSIPPPPPIPSQPQLSEQDIQLPQENVLSESNSILTPPQSIPPPPFIELLHQPQVAPPNIDGPTTHEASPLPSSEVSIPPAPETSPPEKAQEPAPPPPVNIPLPPPLPVQGLTSIRHQPSQASTENQSQEPTPAHVVQEEPITIVTPSLLQMVKLRSINSSPEPPTAQEQPQSEVTMRKQQPSDQVPTSSASGEAPQKPIRRSLIMTSPTPTSPPVTSVTSQTALPKSQSLVAPSASSSTVTSPMKKSPPAMTASPSMNLQEAIRLRTAARSKESPASRLSLHSPTSPIDLHKSPSSTASFIFSKSNKKVVIETKPALEAKASVQNNLEVSSVTKVVSEAESVKKVPPPVAKKPKSKAKESETSEETEQTAGQEAQEESIQDAAEKTNGTAGTVEGEETSST